ncbi:hypothetical protein EJ08DRAFT_278900 [Tothia fuscella]|uniref:Uncharacterized protein n=1 Tax=Tothia fuscella TaxID=1048955 RepID=A0A9P4NQH8_9PEZI|nr:hypothetical protein EJ08DRAFT_278900 [Tothia fuscella]
MRIIILSDRGSNVGMRTLFPLYPNTSTRCGRRSIQSFIRHAKKDFVGGDNSLFKLSRHRCYDLPRLSSKPHLPCSRGRHAKRGRHDEWQLKSFPCFFFITHILSHDGLPLCLFFWTWPSTRCGRGGGGSLWLFLVVAVVGGKGGDEKPLAFRLVRRKELENNGL